ncbi:hypothetical protein XPN_0203, partial [Xanthomonas arboricola pv. pruni MAFF 301427]
PHRAWMRPHWRAKSPANLKSATGARRPPAAPACATT